MQIIRLSNRLMAVAGFIEHGAAVIDVGTDHGYLPVYLAQTGKAVRIIASDKSAGSLEAARRSAEKYGVSDLIEFIVAPGLTGISEKDVDTIVIAGVGGETIAAILEETPWSKNSKRLILQPQTKKELLIKYLCENGYGIQVSAAAQDKNRNYTLFLVY